MGTLELGLMRLRDSFLLWQSQANDACRLAASSLPSHAEKFVLTGGNAPAVPLRRATAPDYTHGRHPNNGRETVPWQRSDHMTGASGSTDSGQNSSRSGWSCSFAGLHSGYCGNDESATNPTGTGHQSNAGMATWRWAGYLTISTVFLSDRGMLPSRNLGTTT